MVDPRENRIHMMLSNKELERIDDWRFANRVATRSDAIRRLCQIALVLDGKLTPLFEATKSYGQANSSFLQAVADLANPNFPDKTEAVNRAALLQLETVPKLMKLTYLIREITGQAYNFKGEGDLDAMMAESEELKDLFADLTTRIGALDQDTGNTTSRHLKKAGKNEEDE